MQDADELFDLVSRGRYLDVWSEDTGRWRIVRRTYVSDLVTTQPVVIRDLHEKLPRAAGLTCIAATRDRPDRYYRYFAEAAVARLE
jgi:hypothetical protein